VAQPQVTVISQQQQQQQQQQQPVQMYPVAMAQPPPRT